MLKRKKKKVDRMVKTVVSSDMAIHQSAKALKRAQKIAEYNKDLDALVVIAERWMTLSRVLEADKEDSRIPMGFIRDEGSHEHES